MIPRRVFAVTITSVCMLVASLLSSPSALAQRPFSDWTDPEMEDFLLNAEIVEREDIGIGITGSEVVTLDDGEVRHDAQIQAVYIMEPIRRFEDGTTEIGFTDFYTYNIAGYRLDRLINLNMVPVAVPRRDGTEETAFVWWIDDYQMMEVDRTRDEILPPRPLEWVAQVNDGNVFQQLIYNTDPNQGNMLIANDWRVWLIDFTRAFRTHNDLRRPEDLQYSVSRRVYDGLKSLTKDVLQETMDDLITGAQIDAILARRDLIVEHFDALIETRGQDVVLSD